MKKAIFLLLIIGGVWQFYNYSGDVSLGPGVMAPEMPHQQNINSPVGFIIDGYHVTEVAEFNLKAKVLSKKNYSTDREADLSPTDLALGWGNMSDESVLEKIKISQTGRFYMWQVDSFPIPRHEIETYSANMHLIPADNSVKSIIDTVRKGDIIEMSGSLVNVKSNNDDWYWKSSQTRNDTGHGACELVFVKKLSISTH